MRDQYPLGRNRVRQRVRDVQRGHVPDGKALRGGAQRVQGGRARRGDETADGRGGERVAAVAQGSGKVSSRGGGRGERGGVGAGLA